MPEYVAPIKDMQFVLDELVDLDRLNRLPTVADASRDTACAMLEAAAEFASGVLSPLNPIGDRKGVERRGDTVKTAEGFKSAYAQFVEAGWNGMAESPEFGGMGAPMVVSAMVDEMWQSANVSFGGCSTLTKGAARAIEKNGSQELKRLYLSRLVSGEWTGTMNLTEPQAGSDLSEIRTRALPMTDGTFRIVGQKIFISWGDHDLTENIVHLVLARTPDAPPGVRGLSLFLVPKRLLQVDGSPGALNDVRCVSLEEKLGHRAAPNAVMSFGEAAVAGDEHSGAVGYLVGELNRGIDHMFVMMNEARFGVGLEGLGLSERAYQAALHYARERVQGAAAGSRNNAKVPIIRHPDVSRMLLWMKSHVEAQRGLVAMVAAAMDIARHDTDVEERNAAASFVDLMVPVIKGWLTETSVDVTSLCIQVHGGAGYIEHTGVAQYWRDSRVLPIYEGTTGIQANDLVGRKVARDAGRSILQVCQQIRAVALELSRQDGPVLPRIGQCLQTSVESLERSVSIVVERSQGDVREALGVAVPFLSQFSIVLGGWVLGKSALAASRRLAGGGSDRSFPAAKIETANFYATHVLVTTQALALTVAEGGSAPLVEWESYD